MEAAVRTIVRHVGSWWAWAPALVVVAALVAGAPSPASAQGRWLPRLELDNDVYNFWRRHTARPDEEYTNGVRVSVEALDGSWWGRWLAPSAVDCREAHAGQSCRSTRLTLGQALYTPNLDRVPHRVPAWEDERPYFAWLHIATSMRVTSPRAVRSTTLTIGVTGPPAGGELAQSIAHRIGFNERATGWDTQVGFEPGVVLSHRAAFLAGRWGDGQALAVDLTPELAASLGNVRTHAEAGGTLRVGWKLSHPWSPAEWGQRARVEWWLTTGARVMAVARDMSLDGTLRDPDRRVDRLPAVGQYELGAAVRIGWALLSYRAVTRSREYRTGPAHHAWSSVTAAVVARVGG